MPRIAFFAVFFVRGCLGRFWDCVGLPRIGGIARDYLHSWGFRETLSSLKFSLSSLLERIQIVKGWLVGGEPQEEVYDVVVNEGKGASELSATWTDRRFKAGQRAFYYARVLEKATPRWSSFDAVELGVKAPSPQNIQERAWSSSIWYSP